MILGIQFTDKMVDLIEIVQERMKIILHVIVFVLNLNHDLVCSRSHAHHCSKRGCMRIQYNSGGPFHILLGHAVSICFRVVLCLL